MMSGEFWPLDGMSRMDQWRTLHDWASSFRYKNNVTAKQFLQLFGLPFDDWYSMYLYSHRRNMDPLTSGVEEELFKGLMKIYKSFQPVDDEQLAADRFATYRDDLRERGVLDCYFDKDAEGKLVADCYVDGSISPEHDNLAQLIREVVRIDCNVKIVPTELSSSYGGKRELIIQTPKNDAQRDETVTIPLTEYKRLLRKAEDLELLTTCSFYDEVDPWVMRCAHPGCKARAVTNGGHGNKSDQCYDCDSMVMCDSQHTCSTKDGDTYYCNKHASLYLIEDKRPEVTYRMCRGCLTEQNIKQAALVRGPKDVEIVMQQAKCSMEEAERRLIEHGGDIVDAITGGELRIRDV